MEYDELVQLINSAGSEKSRLGMDGMQRARAPCTVQRLPRIASKPVGSSSGVVVIKAGGGLSSGTVSRGDEEDGDGDDDDDDDRDVEEPKDRQDQEECAEERVIVCACGRSSKIVAGCWMDDGWISWGRKGLATAAKASDKRQH